jgi:predicted acylesterase/phospholipase RssA
MGSPPQTRFFTSCVAAFQGGGCRAAALVGAVEEALSRGVNFVEFAGTSAGSIVAALMGAGADANYLESAVSAIDFDKLFLAPAEDLGPTHLSLPFPIRSLLALLRLTKYRQYCSALYRLGLYSSVEIEKWMNERLQELLGMKGEVLFEHLIFPTWIVSTDIPNRDVKIWSKLTPDKGVAKAVRASCSIPGYFQPIEKSFVDGGVLSNLPTFVYVEGPRRTAPLSKRILGFALKADASPNDQQNPFDLVKGLVETVIDGATEVQLRAQPEVHVISIPTAGVRATDVDKMKNKETVDSLLESGRRAARSFFEEELRRFQSTGRANPLCGDNAEMYSAIVENLDNAVQDVLISGQNTSWIFKLFPAFLYWTTKRLRVRVLVPSVQHRDADEVYRRALLRSMGAIVAEVPHTLLPAFIFDGNDATRASGVVGIRGPDDRKEAFAMKYSAPYDSEVIAALYERISQNFSGDEKDIVEWPALRAADESALLNVLRAVRQYSHQEEVKLENADVPLDSLLALRKHVNEYKYRQAELLSKLYRAKGIPLFAAADVTFGDRQTSIAGPPVVEKSGDKYVLIEGTARAVFCLRYRKTLGETLRCVVAEGVGEPLPAQPCPLKYVLPVTRDPGISVNYANFRPVENVLQAHRAGTLGISNE